MPPKQEDWVDPGQGSGGSPAEDEPQWHAMSKEQAVAILGLNPGTIRREGLTSADAKARLEQYGHNELSEKKKVSLLLRIWKQVGNALVGILVVVAVVSLVKGIVSTGEDRISNLLEVVLIVFVIV